MKNLVKIVIPVMMSGAIFMSSCSKRTVKSLSGDNQSKYSLKDYSGFVISHDTITGSMEAPAIRNKPYMDSTSIPETNPVTEKIIEDLLKTARSYLGVPHCMGGTTFRCIDCSGFVMKVFEEYGIILPHNAQAQSKFGRIIRRKDELIKGDIVFFKESYRTGNYITHSGIYIGDNQFIHTSSGKGVTITPLDDSWWKNKFVYGSRLIE